MLTPTDKGADARGVELWRSRPAAGWQPGRRCSAPEVERWALPAHIIRSKVAPALGSPGAAPELEVQCSVHSRPGESPGGWR